MKISTFELPQNASSCSCKMLDAGQFELWLGQCGDIKFTTIVDKSLDVSIICGPDFRETAQKIIDTYPWSLIEAEKVLPGDNKPRISACNTACRELFHKAIIMAVESDYSFINKVIEGAYKRGFDDGDRHRLGVIRDALKIGELL